MFIDYYWPDNSSVGTNHTLASLIYYYSLTFDFKRNFVRGSLARC
jgi:hypothetical protein